MCEIIATIRRDNKCLDQQKPFINKVETLINKGVNVFRFNLEKWTDSELEYLYADIQVIREMYNEEQFKVLLDIPYPNKKSRIITENKKNLYLKKGQEIKIVSVKSKEYYQNVDAWISIENIGQKIVGNHFIVYGDGSGKFKLKEICNKDSIVLEAVNDFEFGHGKAMCFENSIESNEIELERLVKIINHVKPNIVALSFLEHPEQVTAFRKFIPKECVFMAKIESNIGVDNIDKIMQEADALMVARGDLGLNIPVCDFAKVQLNLIKAAKKVDKEVYVATDILNSMINNKIPTRADINDLYLIKKSKAHGVVVTYGLVRSEQIIEAIDLIRSVNID